jgi:hypothetical protein
MKKFFLCVLFLLLAPAKVNAGPSTWLDITNLPSPPSAVPGCAIDAGPAINNAISLASMPGTVIFFPTGCYLIDTQIVDNRGSVYGITYLGYGRVELQAGNSLTGSIMLFGGDNVALNTVSRRRVSNLYLECQTPSGGQPGIDGIDLDGFVNSVIDDVEIRDCPNYGMRTMGNNNSNFQNVFDNGLIVTYIQNAKGVLLEPGANGWVFKGTKISNSFQPNPPQYATGTGLDFDSFGLSCEGCVVQGWAIGIAMAAISSGGSVPYGGMDIEGGYFEANTASDIRVGLAGQATSEGAGVSIHGAYFNGTLTPNCIELEWVDGFSVVGNHFRNCISHNVNALADGTNQGADNGIVGPNIITGAATDQLLGSNITAISAGQLSTALYGTSTNCSSSSSPAVCGSAAGGSVAVAAGANTLVVETTAVTTNSQVLLTFDSSLGTRLGVICNTTPILPALSARSSGTSFTIQLAAIPVKYPACYSYMILN